MLYERHNRGKVFGSTAEVCPQTLLCKNSYIKGRADVYQSSITDSRVIEAKVRNSIVEHGSTVGSNRLQAEVYQSRIHRSQIYGGTVLLAYVNNSRISGKCQLRGGGKGLVVVNSDISGNVYVANEAQVYGIKLNKQMRVTSGIWNFPPRYFEVKTENIHLGITESTDAFAHIGCKRKKMADWIKGKNRFGKAAGWSSDITDFIALKFEEWLDCPVKNYG